MSLSQLFISLVFVHHLLTDSHALWHGIPWINLESTFATAFEFMIRFNIGALNVDCGWWLRLNIFLIIIEKELNYDFNHS